MPAIWIPKRMVEISLINTAALSPQAFVHQCEQEYDNRIQAAASEVLASGCRIVMLTGPSASGKTTTAQKLAQTLCQRGMVAQVISLDNFYKNLDLYPRLPDGTKDYENITALDVEEIQRCLAELAETGRTQLPQFDFVTENRKEQRIPLDLQGGICIVEGIHALNPLLTSKLPPQKLYKIYAGLREEYSYRGQRVIPSRDVRLARRMVRDHKFRGHDLEKTIGMWNQVCTGEDQFIRVFKTQADLLVDTSFSYEICMLAHFVTPWAGWLPQEHPCAEKLNQLAGHFALVHPIDLSWLPEQSMLREFLG
ncbi:MAG: AAA family ATPase [Candidatus Fournierella pullistercoris]|uniref:AAA family ATPase n=1 Tax=Candidatus Allofournierella pullistercoris TaxID=2838597 RepID=A0A948T1J2_9FIRM|nr:AAA family ATPase [Candidatus Fournierella pullistercoris]